MPDPQRHSADRRREAAGDLAILPGVAASEIGVWLKALN
jgi:hypothetical protein